MFHCGVAVVNRNWQNAVSCLCIYSIVMQNGIYFGSEYTSNILVQNWTFYTFRLLHSHDIILLHSHDNYVTSIIHQNSLTLSLRLDKPNCRVGWLILLWLEVAFGSVYEMINIMKFSAIYHECYHGNAIQTKGVESSRLLRRIDKLQYIFFNQMVICSN